MIQISFPGTSDASTAPAAAPAPAPAPAAAATSKKSNSKLNKALAIAGGSIGGALALGLGGYYGMKKYGASSASAGDDDLYYDEEPHISVPMTDPDPVAAGLNQTIGELGEFI